MIDFKILQKINLAFNSNELLLLGKVGEWGMFLPSIFVSAGETAPPYCLCSYGLGKGNSFLVSHQAPHEGRHICGEGSKNNIF